MKIRLAKKSDLKELARIFKKVYDHFDVGERWTNNAAYKYLEYIFKAQPDLAFLGEVDGKIAGGFFASIKPWWDGNHLVNGELFVDPNYQKHGLGLKLSIKLYEKAIKKYNAVIAESTTFKNKKFPLVWHKKRGFKINDDWVLIWGNTNDMLQRMKKLSRKI